AADGNQTGDQGPPWRSRPEQLRLGVPRPPRDEIRAAGRTRKKVLPGQRYLSEDESLGGGEDSPARKAGFLAGPPPGPPWPACLGPAGKRRGSCSCGRR